MNKILSLFSVLAIGFNTYSQCSDLFFSEYIEGSSSNKAFEIYNPTNSAIDLSDYVVYRNNNGSLTPTDSLFPLGIIAPGAVFITGNPSANPTIMAQADTTHTMTFYNGDDALWLKNIVTGDTIDMIGEIGVDPGSGWPVGTGATNNFTLIRMISIQKGVTNWTVGATEWDVFSIDMTDSLGAHTMTPCCIPTNSTITESACDTYTSPSGNYVWTSSNTYMDTIPNAANCDSVITINLTINTVNSSVTQIGPLLTADQSGVNYQWLDCPGMTPIMGAINQSYTALADGDFAVIVSVSGCLDTSTCYTVLGVGIIENNFGNELLIYPNPTDGDFSVDLGANYQTTNITITDLNGELILSNSYNDSQLINLKIEKPAGFYLLNIESGKKKAIIRLLKK